MCRICNNCYVVKHGCYSKVNYSYDIILNLLSPGEILSSSSYFRRFRGIYDRANYTSFWYVLHDLAKSGKLFFKKIDDSRFVIWSSIPFFGGVNNGISKKD